MSHRFAIADTGVYEPKTIKMFAAQFDRCSGLQQFLTGDCEQTLKTSLERTRSMEGSEIHFLGRPANGRLEWKNAEGKSLKQLEQELSRLMDSQNEC